MKNPVCLALHAWGGSRVAG